MRHRGFAALTVIFLILALVSWKNKKLRDERPVSYVSTADIAAIRQNINVSQYENIESTLRIVAEKWKRIDVNNDRLYNCIDAAVLFYKYYPDKNNVCIEINVNPKTGMNHLFNCVYVEGVWKAIEPQAYATNQKSYFMRNVWGNKYDNNYNRDDKERWKVYAK